MSTREYDLDEPYEVENTDIGPSIIEFTNSAAADAVVEAFAEKYDTSTVPIDYIPGMNSGMRAEITQKSRSLTGIIYFGDDTVMATETEAENLEETAENVLTP